MIIFAILYAIVAIEWGILVWRVQALVFHERNKWVKFLIILGCVILMPIALPLFIYVLEGDDGDDDDCADFC